jgi:hypothetical protein
MSKKYLQSKKTRFKGRFFEKNHAKTEKNRTTAGKKSSTGPDRPFAGTGYNSDQDHRIDLVYLCS